MKKPIKKFNEGNFTRMCVSCNSRRHKKDMFRIAHSPEGVVYIDETGRGNGRGCYICKSIECLDSAVKSGRAARALKTDVPAEIYEKLRDIINE